ncbi:MAG: polysaccharide deacetylase family protein [Candidatus Omnitrophota bacterium]
MPGKNGRRFPRWLLWAGVAVMIAAAAVAAVIAVKSAYVVPILMYHSIDSGNKDTKLSVSPESFARQMEFLYKNHYNVVSLEKAAAYIKRKDMPPRKTVAITFDDGFRNNYLYAYPVLKKYGLPATMFIVVDWVGTSPNFMNWDEIREMADSGIIAIGSHSKEHHWLLNSSDDILKQELGWSRRILEERTGRRVSSFCYPMGAFDGRAKAAAAAAGYVCAVSTPSESASAEDVYALKRVRISRSSDNLLVFWAETTGLYAFFK